MGAQQLLAGYGASGGGGGATATWNPADKSTRITLSGADLIAAKNSADNQWASVRATLGRSTGKYYFEMNCAATGGGIDASFGIATSAMLLDGTGGGSTVGVVGTGAAGVSYGFYQRDGRKWTSGTLSAYGSGFGASAVVGVAVDLTAGKVWFAVDNVWQASGDPGAGTGEAFSGLSGTYFPACSHYDGTKYTTTGRFKAADQAYTPPAGFSAWE